MIGREDGELLDGLSAGESGVIKGFMRKSCRDSTWNNYSRKGMWWSDYVKETSGSEDWGSCLAYLYHTEKVNRFLHFIHWLYEKGQRETKVKVIISNLRSIWQTCAVNTNWMDDELIKRAIKATRLSLVEQRARPVRTERVDVMPVTTEMKEHARSMFWDKQSWDRFGMDHRMAYLAIALGLDSGNRPSNLTMVDGNNTDHAIRGGDIRFFSSEGVQIVGVEDYRSMVRNGELESIEVAEVRINQATSKTARFESGQNVGISIQRRTQKENEFLEDLCQWFRLAGTRNDEPMFTRKCPILGSSKTLTQKGLCEAVKQVAVSLDLNPAAYSNKSLRIGYATLCSEQGVDDDERNKRGGWSMGSRIPNQVYVRKENKGTLAREVNVETRNGKQ